MTFGVPGNPVKGQNHPTNGTKRNETKKKKMKSEECKKCTCPPCEEPPKLRKVKKLLAKCIDLDKRPDALRIDARLTDVVCYRAPCLDPCNVPCLPVPCVSVDTQCCCAPPMMDEEMMVAPERADKENYIIPQPCCPPSCPPPCCPAPCCPPACCPSCPPC
ncbi:unnamed protein product [Phyllotreta striolata]|uniref:Uncharacterized protein n=1 Tax=Phyllotreta striolata TaxID=444603 RepID=A0A9N9TE64_PHYSR|nr:unnamed protein product [Phyllotreta striolata]